MNTAPAANLIGRLGSWFSPAASAEIAAAEHAALRSDRFRLEREGEWKRLEAIVARIERGRLRGVSDEDLLALPALYRTAVSSLAVARETSLDRETLLWLEVLTQRAWFIVYGPRAGLGDWLARFFGGGWSASVRALGRDILIALALMIVGTVVGWLLVASDPDWYYALMPGGMVDARVPGASRAVLMGTLFGQQNEPGLGIFAAELFSNNAQVALLAFALGFAFGLPSVLLLIQNTTMLGALLWLYHGQGLTLEAVGWLSVHGTTELFAILLAGASGIHIGRAMAFPGAAAVLDAAAAAGRRTAQVMVGVVLMLIVAGLLEGFARQLINNTAGRLIVGGFMLVFWTGYFFVWRGSSESGSKA